ncbi:RB1-inducible coiled-coil protein 1 [Triplophysa dalaica]|uniref:RB1-inducible coiled-coil protein 1 n=1 Tax=Triplophysa dalaica TaxID=1582913 RepID=UPI0024DF902C|nr:RB1-inducible coiled-coil protein 1 [Triplophysa dalaica]XP_056594213.1 RB1-inducible coiled-coil protein 1 [Triplophysa dalaica]
MKLYVFQVNNGSTLTFDTELAVQTVLDLKHAIQAKYKIAIQHQVLVVNGGECMVAERRVCSYSAGTETNPIFLFNKEMILCDRAPTIPKTTFSIENEMELKVEESLMMPAVFHTVASRTQLALEMQEVAKKLCSFCERLVHDEHLQHQGWAAIMANLDDCTLSYQKLLLKFDTAYTNYQQDFEDIKLKLTKLGTAVSVMAKIPLLDCLTQPSYREGLEKSSTPNPRTSDVEDGDTPIRSAIFCPGDDHKNGKLLSASGETSSQASSSPQDRLMSSLKAAQQEEEESPERGATPFVNVTLLDWINVQDRPNDVESVVRKCFDSINRLDPRIIQPFLSECRETITKLDNQNMKAIKGLEDRLYALDQMIASCNKLVNEQKELAQGFHANQKRAENLKDTSVLPDLCLSHANQLMIMLTNHRKLLDIKQKCTTAKQELANNLQVRLKWCCYVMLHADQDGEKLQALLRLLTELLERVRVVEALSTVPQMYCLAVVEVVRRKMFIGHYRQWANALVKDGKNLYEAEKAKRETFGKLFRKSFLRNRLFRGLDSWPSSSFCTRKPRKFDFELPDISLNDLQYLKSCCPSEVQSYLSVPTLCDFKPLNHHVEVLHQLVQAAQSVDEMSRTITDLLNEQKVSRSQNAQRSDVLTARSESTAQSTSTSSKTLTTLSLKAPDCQPSSLPAPLEDLSPDSIDAQTFDFETIGHPNMDPLLHQGSLDLDSLAESPESDFMSAVNEFVIEENLMSPNPISDPTSPEMMVESLYSSVINAIDSKRIQDTTTLEKENSKIAALKRSADRYRSASEESQNNLRKVKEDLYHFRGLVLKEQRDFGFSLKTTTNEVWNFLNSIRYRQEEELRETQQTNLQSLKDDHEKQLLTLTEELEGNRRIVRDVQRAMLELEGLVERKEKEISQLESERERSAQELQNLRDLEEKTVKQSEELKAALLYKDELVGQLEKLHIEIERGQQRIKQEMENAEKMRLQELEDQLNQRHEAELESVRRDKQSALDVLAQDNLVKRKELMDSHSAKLKEREGRLKDLEARVEELGDARCKLEVELALKDAEIEDARLQYEEARSSNEEVLKSEMTAQTAALQTQMDTLNQQLQQKNEEYEVGLAELRALMRLEKDHCISELVDRHEEESILLRQELSALKQKSQDAEKDCEERVQKIQQCVESQLHALRKVEEDELKVFQLKEQELRGVVGDLQAENTLLSVRLEQERTEAQQRAELQKEEAVQAALQEAFRDFQLQKEEIEKRLLGKMEQLEHQLKDRQSTETVASCVEVGVDASSDFPQDSGQWSEEKTSLLAKLELLERTKNEEMQNVKTSLIAEQQTNFNTVLTRERLKKEQIVHEVTEKLNNVMQQQEKDKGLIETLSEDRATILQEKKQLEEELNRLRNTVLVSSSYFPPNPGPIITEAQGACGPAHVDVLSPSVPDSEKLASIAALKDEERVESAVEASMMSEQDNPMLSEEKQRILILERTLHMKEEENKRLSQRLMSQSMSSVSSRHSEKIAIRDFQVGDLVLIILDERHDNYVLFTVGPILYFLHSESLTALDLKPATGATRRPWVLGKVMEKEYCQAKKAQNRFKVPLGTKFYRVKAVPWNKKV